MVSPERPSGPPASRRWPYVLLLVPSLLWVGLVAGALIGALWLVPEGSGLAGPAIVLGYGVLGAGVGALLAGIVGWKAPRPWLLAVTALAAFLALAAAGAVLWRAWTVRAEGRTEPGMELPPSAAGSRQGAPAARSRGNSSARGV